MIFASKLLISVVAHFPADTQLSFSFVTDKYGLKNVLQHFLGKNIFLKM